MEARGNSIWSIWAQRPELEIKLRELQAQTPVLSCSQMAAELGCGITRNAVIGKLRRMGLQSRTEKGRLCTPRQRKSRTITVRRTHASFAQPEIAPDELPAPVISDLEIPKEQRRSILGQPYSKYPSRKSGECCWPIGDVGEADFFFCGAAVKSDESYCSAHCARAFQAPIKSGGRFLFKRPIG
jgi:GcrA cell cycle regulator